MQRKKIIIDPPQKYYNHIVSEMLAFLLLKMLQILNSFVLLLFCRFNC